MGEWIDFRELRSKLNFKDVLEKYGVRLNVRGGKQAVGPCPLPNHAGGKSKESFSANLEKGIFQCFSCGAKGNVLDFACLMDRHNPENGEELRLTALSLVEHFKLTSSKAGDDRRSAKGEPKPAPEGKIVVNGELDFELKGLDPTHEYLRLRRFEPKTISTFGLGYCSRGYLNGRIAIPIHDRDGKLVGYAGRLAQLEKPPKEIPKYLFPGTRIHKGITHEFRKSLLLYNAHRIKAPVETLTVVEGFPSVWWLTQNGYPNSVALMGDHISEEQLKIALSLIAPSGQIILIADGDTAGRELAKQAEALFKGNAKLRIVQLRDLDQPSNLNPEELAECFREWKGIPAGRGGGVSPREDIAELVSQFPCLAHLRITSETWDAEAFEKQTGKFSSGELSIAQFILGVWNPTTAWKCGKFDLVEAAARLDDEHRQPIIDWFSDPWWP